MKNLSEHISNPGASQITAALEGKAGQNKVYLKDKSATSMNQSLNKSIKDSRREFCSSDVSPH